LESKTWNASKSIQTRRSGVKGNKEIPEKHRPTDEEVTIPAVSARDSDGREG